MALSILDNTNLQSFWGRFSVPNKIPAAPRVPLSFVDNTGRMLRKSATDFTHAGNRPPLTTYFKSFIARKTFEEEIISGNKALISSRLLPVFAREAAFMTINPSPAEAENPSITVIFFLSTRLAAFNAD